jgi:hypothetical protein
LTIQGMQDVNENLFLRLQMEAASQLSQCYYKLKESSEANSSDSVVPLDEQQQQLNSLDATQLQFLSLAAEIGKTLNTMLGKAQVQKLVQDGQRSQVIYPVPLYFDLSGLGQMAACCGLYLLEFYYVHAPHLALASTSNAPEQYAKRELYDFLLKKHPLSCVLLFSAIGAMSFVAWVGLLNRTTFVDITFKVLLTIAISGPIAFLVHNLLRIKVMLDIILCLQLVYIFCFYHRYQGYVNYTLFFTL